MSILDNAIDSIILGLEDYQMTDSRRKISATRNIFAGILLLFKYKLVLLSPSDSDEVLIKQKILPQLTNSGDLVWKGKGQKTVDVQSIQERFKSLNISVNWSRLEKIQAYRNEIEHYYSTKDGLSVDSMISSCFIVIRDFIVNELDLNPSDLLGIDNWQILLDINEVYEQEKQECNLKLENLDYSIGDIGDYILDAFQNGLCPKCKSDLLTTTSLSNTKIIDANFICKHCDEYFEYDIIGKLLPENNSVYSSFLGDKFSDIESNLMDCPSCYETTYFIKENECAACFNSVAVLCERCGADIPPEELTDEHNLCGYCFYMFNKMLED